MVRLNRITQLKSQRVKFNLTSHIYGGNFGDPYETGVKSVLEARNGATSYRKKNGFSDSEKFKSMFHTRGRKPQKRKRHKTLARNYNTTPPNGSPFRVERIASRPVRATRGRFVKVHSFAIGLLSQPAIELFKNSEAVNCEANLRRKL